ncbi:MAG: glycoside hydrolase family 2 protein [Faecousia sp.]
MENEKCQMNRQELYGSEWTIFGCRENCRFQNGILTTKDCWAANESVQLKNVDFRFTARAPETAAQVDIWASFRHYNREYRYMVGLRGGSHKHLYLARLGAVGYDRMLALCPLEWSAMPGVWYQIRVVCAGQRIAVYLNQEQTPRILCEDTDAPFQTGCIALGGGFVETEFKDVSVGEVAENALDGVEKQPDFLETVTLPQERKEEVRRKDRALYRPYAVPRLPEDRLELPLDRKWLFIPDYEVQSDPAEPAYDDSKAHTIHVPESWIPLQAWLEGETMGKDRMNKGQSDNYYLEEFARCGNFTFDYQKTQFAWYRHYIDLPEGIGTKCVYLDFEAIALASAVYCNGVKVHENIGMFTPMRIDITDQVHPGRNVIAVKVSRVLPDDAADSSAGSIDDFYVKARETASAAVPASNCEHRPFCTDDLPHGFYANHPGGIWRGVKLLITDKLHIEDIWFRPTLEDASIEVTLANQGEDAREATLSYSLVHTVTGETLCAYDEGTFSIGSGQKRVITIQTPKVSPRLWGPGMPNLYKLTLWLHRHGDRIDTRCEKVGFRTVKFSGNTLLYNGQPLWVRGGNHMPAHVRPNDEPLARKYMALALEHNVFATRTHGAPWTDIWLDAADEAGMMISLEGTWPWLMIDHIPCEQALSIWKKELRQLYRRHRNRPSLFLITMNNEMNFYLTHDPDDVVREKGYLVQGGLKIAREVFPDLPLVCDSGYYRGPTTQHGKDRDFSFANGRFERIIQPNHYDDGDLDDPHFYYGWYFPDFFHFMNGEFGRDMTLPGRPCLLQECSVGYCRAEDGHAVRSYLFEHQTPQTTTGKRAYEHNDPRYFQHNHAFQVQGLVEMFRRVEHDRVCGVLLFSFETWFYHHHDPNRIQPMLSAKRLQAAYQPVLASAELFCRHFYAGRPLRTNVTLINDDRDAEALRAPRLEAALIAEGETLASAELTYEDLPYFATASLPLVLQVPETLPRPYTQAKLVLKVWEESRLRCRNEYDLVLAEETWASPAPGAETTWYLSDDPAAEALLSLHHIPASPCTDLAQLEGTNARLVVAKALGEEASRAVRHFAQAGGRVVMVNQRDLSGALTGGKPIRYTEDTTEIVTMNVPENSVFAGIDELDLAWFENGRGVPYAAYGRYSLNRMDPELCALAETLQWHNYIAKPTDYGKLGGTPLFAMTAGKGTVLVSSIRTDADRKDPVACRMTHNILSWDFQRAGFSAANLLP